MNQILSTNNNYYNNNTGENKTVVKIFAIVTIVVAIAIILVALNSLNKNKKIGNSKPVLEIVREDLDVQAVSIKANCDDGIKYVVYTWNNQDEKKVNLNGSTTFERIVDMPNNEVNILKVEVVSINGIKEEKQEELKLNIDTNKPKINSLTIVDSKLQVDVSDDTGIDYIEYQWEDEDSVIINANQNDNKSLKTDIDIKRGTYKLKITVVDISGNKEQMSNLITGVNEPEISAIKYDNIVHVTVTHDRGFKEIEYIVNDKLYVYDEEYSGYDKNKTTIELDFPLIEGENLIQVKAYSLEKLTDEETDEDDLKNYAFKKFTGKCTYEQ